MKKDVLIATALLGSALAAPFAFARDVAPDVAMKTVTLEVISLIRQDKDILAGNPTRIAHLVEIRILPHFDFDRMTRTAAARSWRVATPEQQKTLTAEFRTLVVHTYSTALSLYRDRVIEFKQLRAPPGDSAVTVKSVVKQPGTAPLTMDYEMEKSAAGWKVYDIKIEGVSLITNYRETFAVKVREAGVDGLIKSLSDKNRHGENRLRAQLAEDFYPAFIRSILQSLGNRRAGITAAAP